MQLPVLRALRANARHVVQRTATAQRAASQAAIRRVAPSQCRNISSSRARLNAEKSAGEGAAKDGRPQDALVLTPYEKVAATAQGSLWIGLLGIGMAGVYFVVRELLPSRMSPNGLFSETLDFVSENTEVTSRIGMPVYGYGHDHGGHREGRRNRIEHVNLKDKDGNPRLRIKYNIKGPSGHAYVFAETNHDMKKNEYVYLIIQFTKTGELVKLVDNRQILAAESKEEQDALRQLLG